MGEMKSGHGQGKDEHEQWRREQEKAKQIAELGGRRAWEKKTGRHVDDLDDDDFDSSALMEAYGLNWRSVQKMKDHMSASQMQTFRGTDRARHGEESEEKGKTPGKGAGSPPLLVKYGVCEAGVVNGFPIKKGMELVAIPTMVDLKSEDMGGAIKVATVVEVRKDGVARAGKFLVDQKTGLGFRAAVGEAKGKDAAKAIKKKEAKQDMGAQMKAQMKEQMGSDYTDELFEQEFDKEFENAWEGGHWVWKGDRYVEEDNDDNYDEDYNDEPYREWKSQLKSYSESSECDIAVPWLCLVPSVKKCRAIITKTLGKFTPETKEMRITMFVSRYLGCHPEKDNDMRRVLTMALQALGAQDILKALLSGGS